MCGRATLAMLVSSNSMNVAKVTVMAMSQGLTIGLAADGATGRLNGSEMTCVPNAAPRIHRKQLSQDRCVHCTQRLKNETLFEGAGDCGDDLVLHSLRILPGIGLAGGNEGTGQSMNGYADDLGSHLHVHLEAFGFGA